MKILIIDDDPDFCKTVRRFLVSRGYQTLIANSGETGLKAVRTTCFDAVVCDLHLFGMTGFDVLQVCRVQFPDLPVIVVTGDHDLDNAVQAFRYGAFDHFKKPVDLQGLVDCLDRIQALNSS